MTDGVEATAAPALEGRVALVTGGGSGIGRATALALAAQGASVAVTGRRLAPLEETAEAVRALGVRALAIAGDVASAVDAARMVAETAEAFGGLHIVVNNAGIAAGGPLADMDAATVDALIDIDLKGPIHLTRAALPHLAAQRDQDGSTVINVGSSVTHHPLPSYSVYSAAKAGLDMLTRCWARELAGDRIRVNAVCPGVVRTPIHDAHGSERAVDRFLRAIAEQTPLGRIGAPEEIARLIVFLAAPTGAWITGAVIPIDGGLSLT